MAIPLAKPRSKRNILRLTEIIRESLGLRDKLYFPIMYFLENILTQIDPELVIDITDDGMDNIYACYIPQENTLKIRTSVYERACDDVGRDRFTIAHEIGHYFLHRKGVILSRRDSGHVESFYDPEWQANTFASFILMPPSLIRNMTNEEIACKCCTSLSAAMIANKKSQTL